MSLDTDKEDQNAEEAPQAGADCRQLPPDTDLETLAATIKVRWGCEQAHQEFKEDTVSIISRADHRVVCIDLR